MSMRLPNAITGPLRTGSSGPSVVAVQIGLNTALNPSPGLVPDGAFGPKTAQAVRSFQQRNELGADGVVGPKTAAALGLNYTPGAGSAPVPAPPARPPLPGMPPAPSPPSSTPPAPGVPPGFVNLTAVSVIVEAVISGYQGVASAVLSWIDSDYVPQIVYDRVASIVNGTVNKLASRLRGLSRNVVNAGQDPALYFTAKIRDILAQEVSTLSGALQLLVGLPIIGGVASGYQNILSSVMSVADVALDGLRNNGQSAQAAASRILAIFEGVARRIG